MNNISVVVKPVILSGVLSLIKCFRFAVQWFILQN